MERPSELVRSEAYLRDLESAVAAGRFPDPDPDLVGRLTEARFVARAAREAGEAAFAEAVAGVRDPVFEPIERFDEAMAEIRAVEEAEEDESPERAREIVEALDDRTRTYLDYPGPPHDFVEACEALGFGASGGEDLPGDVDVGTVDRERRIAALTGPDGEAETYAEQRTRVEAVVAGARAYCTGAYREAGDRIADRGSGYDYDDAAEYAATVAFNAGTAAEAWLADRGEIPRAP